MDILPFVLQTEELAYTICSDLMLRDLGDYSPVEHAVTYGNLPAVKYLLDHGADLHQKRSGDVTLLHSAAIHGHSEIVKFLLSRGADVDALSVTGTPLSLAAFKGHASTVKILLQHNADFGRSPIELAVEYGTREDINILFPFTSPISTVTNWSVDGIISHVKMEIKHLEDGNFVKTRMSDLKRQGDYLNASVFYTQALKIDNFNAKLLSNRSLCWLRMRDGEMAFGDAHECIELRPNWAKAHYRLGAALMFMKDYNSAYRSLSRALVLDPESEEVEKLFWEAMELRS